MCNNMLKMLKLTSRTMKNEVFFRKFSTRRPVMPWNPLTVQKMGSASSASTIISQNLIPGMELSQEQAKDVALRLTSEEREILITALQECQSLKVENIPQPQTSELMRVAVANAIPFIGFGFLDNFVMIVAGDSIEATLGATIAISTMAAAALGNTISDVLGIGSAYYVERLAQKVGFKPPKLTPLQLDLPRSRMFANMGRVFGVMIGCLLGMIPLIVLNKNDENSDEEDKK